MRYIDDNENDDVDDEKNLKRMMKHICDECERIEKLKFALNCK